MFRQNLMFLNFLYIALFYSGIVVASERPNIILMLADDMGIGDTSAYQDFTGNHDEEQVSTPNMERLARRGVRFTDAHTPSTRCSPTRYALMTGRYPWRNRLKHWVLFGAQGDPMIEKDRPTIATMLKSAGYHTAMVGKWHIGLRYRRTDGMPAAGFDDADLRMPLLDSPLDHGFDQCWITSRSHGTSGPQPNTKKNHPMQTVGPGHINGRIVLGATNNTRQITNEMPNAYVLKDLGQRHSDNAIRFLNQHLKRSQTSTSPFFLYYASNSNHTPHTPSEIIGETKVAGKSKSVAGQAMDIRSDFIYENDVALGRLLDYLESHDDPRNPGAKLIQNTLVIFTSDNGAEKNHDTATGPFRSNKGSCYEGGHRVPFIASCPNAGIGDGSDKTPGETNNTLIGLQDVFATFADLIDVPLPDLRSGQKGAEDSVSVLDAMWGEPIVKRPMFFHDHKQSEDHAVSVIRFDEAGSTPEGVHQWKLFFDSKLLRHGHARPIELYNLANDPRENSNILLNAENNAIVKKLAHLADLHRNVGGHRLVEFASNEKLQFEFTQLTEKPVESDSSEWTRNVSEHFHDHSASEVTVTTATKSQRSIEMTIKAAQDGNFVANDRVFRLNARGMGVSGGMFDQVESGESLQLSFNQDVIVESVAIVAGNGDCGGYYRVGKGAPLAIYCVDADIDAKDQSGILSDLGVLKVGEALTLDSRAHYGVETPGRWRLQSVTVRLLKSVE